MRTAIRVDASVTTGIGHVMRSLTLADSLRAHGADTRFICRELPGSMADLIRSRHHDLRMLPSPPEGMAKIGGGFLAVSQEQDARDSLAATADVGWEWLIVDHNGIDATWQRMLRPAARKMMVIDDQADRQHDCDVLLDQNMFPDMTARYRGLVAGSCRQLLGPEFALLRPEFRELRARIAPRKGSVRRVIVSFGGTDSQNLTERTLTALESLGNLRLTVDVVIGSDHPNRAQIESRCAANGFDCYVQTPQIAELMSKADLAVGAGGSTSWERCCLGLATICISVAANQYPIARALAAEGASIFLGDESAVAIADIADAISTLCADDRRLAQLSTRAYELVDGLGASRVRDILESL